MSFDGLASIGIFICGNSVLHEHNFVGIKGTCGDNNLFKCDDLAFEKPFSTAVILFFSTTMVMFFFGSLEMPSIKVPHQIYVF